MTESRTLSDLIRGHQETTGDSYGDIAKRAGLSKAKVGQLAIANQPHMPRVDTIEKLAAGLNMPLRIVQRAAMASAGINPPDEDGVTDEDLLAAKISQLPERERQIIVRMVDALVAEGRADA